MEELESGRDNLPENLSNSDKASQLEEAIEYLSSAESDLCGIEEPADLEELGSLLDTLRYAMDNLESVEFPGMFG